MLVNPLIQKEKVKYMKVDKYKWEKSIWYCTITTPQDILKSANTSYQGQEVRQTTKGFYAKRTVQIACDNVSP